MKKMLIAFLLLFGLATGSVFAGTVLVDDDFTDPDKTLEAWNIWRSDWAEDEDYYDPDIDFFPLDEDKFSIEGGRLALVPLDDGNWPIVTLDEPLRNFKVEVRMGFRGPLPGNNHVGIRMVPDTDDEDAGNRLLFLRNGWRSLIWLEGGSGRGEETLVSNIAIMRNSFFDVKMIVEDGNATFFFEGEELATVGGMDYAYSIQFYTCNVEGLFEYIRITEL